MPISRDNSGALHHGLAREYDGFTVPSCKKVRHSAHEIIDALEKPAWAKAFRSCDVVQCFLSLAKIAEGRCYVSMRESKVRVEGKCLLILLNSLFAPPALLIHITKRQVHPWIRRAAQRPRRRRIAGPGPRLADCPRWARPDSGRRAGPSAR